MRIRHDWMPIALGCGLLAAAGAGAAEPGATAAANSDEKAIAAPQPAEGLPVFVPPSRGAPKSRVGGATRGRSAAGAASLAVLVPEDGGLTLEAQPVLYWYLSEPTTRRVDVTIVDDASVAPLLEATIPGPLAAGVHRVRLADHGISLAAGVRYQWFVALVPDAQKRSSDVIAGGSIERVAAPEPLRQKLGSAAAQARPNVFAEAGIWYDALAASSQAIESAPRDRRALDTRAALLDQVGLTEIARADRASAGEAQDPR